MPHQVRETNNHQPEDAGPGKGGSGTAVLSTMIDTFRRCCSRGTLLALSLALSAAGGRPAAAATTFRALDNSVYATVAGKVLSFAEYRSAVRVTVRREFYHGTIPKGRLESVRSTAGKDLITSTLMLQEVRRRGVTPDVHRVQEAADKYEQHYRGNKEWEKKRAQIMPRLLRYLRDRDVIHKLAQQVRHVPPPSEAQLRAYYERHLNEFTEPEQYRISVILLGVDPGAPAKAWDAARSKAMGIFKRLQAGADFGKIARLRSTDSSAARGGDMGYVHKGMLALPIQKVIDKLKPGQFSEPVTLLRGVALFRLNGVHAAKREDFKTVRARVRALWLRERGERAWKALIERLWRTTKIVVNKKYTPSFLAGGTGPVTGKAFGQGAR